MLSGCVECGPAFGFSCFCLGMMEPTGMAWHNVIGKGMTEGERLYAWRKWGLYTTYL